MKNRKAFSLIELLISLIIISLTVAAFAPIMTKKLRLGRTLNQGDNQEVKLENCEEGYILNGTKCCPLIENCEQYDEDCKCTQCSVSAPKHCANFDKSVCKCIACETYYHLDSDAPDFCWLNLDTENAGDIGGSRIREEEIDLWCQLGETCYLVRGEPACLRNMTPVNDERAHPLEGRPYVGSVYCNWWAADAICKSRGKVLPTSTMMDELKDDYKEYLDQDKAVAKMKRYNLCFTPSEYYSEGPEFAGYCEWVKGSNALLQWVDPATGEVTSKPNLKESVSVGRWCNHIQVESVGFGGHPSYNYADCLSMVTYQTSSLESPVFSSGFYAVRCVSP